MRLTLIRSNKDAGLFASSCTCFVGNQSSKSLLALVIIPQTICLLLGCMFLSSGLRAALRRPPAPPAPSTLLPAPLAVPVPAHRDQSVLRLGAFAGLYAVPLGCIIGTWMYEYAWRDDWLAAPSPSLEPATRPRPAFWVFLFRIFASQILGVMVAVWIATPRLKELWRRLLGPRKPAPVKVPAGPPPPLTLQYYSAGRAPPRHAHHHSTCRPPAPHHYSYRKPRHYHYSAGETIL
ncbi:Frizzled-5 [Eumeta japonica]|uniref:Frizzled-5 n=1 Tax=Eumeta variegata TaxID=151549 RepID=A0A4C1UPW0_EUMVA|nr:Frizzled-5 [Eumeta japonica]